MKKLLMAIAAVISAVVTGFADVTVASADGTITVTIPANTVTVSAPVYLVWDTSDKGDDLADWTNKAKLGEVGAEGGTFDVAGATHSIPNGAAIRAFITANRIYMAVDYLQSSGGAYIDTGLKLTQADKMTCDFGITDQVPASTYWWIAGSRTSSTANSFVCFVQSGDDADHLKVFVDYSSYLTSRAGSTTGDLKTQLIVGNRYTAVNCSTERSVTLADASDPFLCDTRTISDTFTTYGNVFLFYANAPEKGGLPSGSAKFTGRIYSYKVERGDEVLQDLVPALNDSGVACMFDKTNGEYLQNVGAGTLTYGGTPHEESVPVSGMADEIASDTAIYAASEPPTPVGGVELSSADGTITVTVDANTVTESTPVYLVWDTSDKGDDLADWTNKANLGDVTAAGGTFNVTGATHSIANGAAIRAFVMAGDKVDLYASLTKPKAVSGLVDLGYSPGKTVGTSGIDIDFKIENLSLGSGVTYIFFGICDYSSEAATEAGNSWGENFHVACGSSANGYYHIQARPQANDHKDYKTANYTIAPPNVQILATRHLLRARTGEVSSLLLGGVTAYSAASSWPSELTWDYAPGTVAVFGRNDNPPKTESPRYFQYGDMTLYGLKIYEKKQEAHVCVRDYVPAAKNGTKGLYETISGGFYPASAANFTFEGSATNTLTVGAIPSAAATYNASGDEPMLDDMTVTVTDAAATAFDGTLAQVGLTVTYPASADVCEQLWDWDDGAGYVHDAPARYYVVGTYTNRVKLTATGFHDFYGTGVVTVAEGQQPTGSYVDFAHAGGPVKPVNGVCGVPMEVLGWLQTWEAFPALKEAGIPYARLHDMQLMTSSRRGLFIDIPNIFPVFTNDVEQATNYRFGFTDNLIAHLYRDIGVQPIFRLGVSREEFVAKGLPPLSARKPADAIRWAKICEKIILHYTQNWNNKGYTFDIPYWEIWSSPDDHSTISSNVLWNASFDDYKTFYGTVATYLKGRFPNLKFGGYTVSDVAALSRGDTSELATYRRTCAESFLAAARDNGWPLDFFSYRLTGDIAGFSADIAAVDTLLDDYGFTRDRTVRFCSEWLPAPTEEKLGSAQQVAEIAAGLTALQQGPCDLACLYSALNVQGMYAPLFKQVKPETPRPAINCFKAYHELRKLGTAVRVRNLPTGVFATAASDGGQTMKLLVANVSGADWTPTLAFAPWTVVSAINVSNWTTASLPAGLPNNSVWLLTLNLNN